jgi:hypothetical protein
MGASILPHDRGGRLYHYMKIRRILRHIHEVGRSLAAPPPVAETAEQLAYSGTYCRIDPGALDVTGLTMAGVLYGLNSTCAAESR